MKGSKKICLFQSFKTSLLLFLLLLSWVFVAFFVVAVAVAVAVIVDIAAATAVVVCQCRSPPPPAPPTTSAHSALRAPALPDQIRVENDAWIRLEVLNALVTRDTDFRVTQYVQVWVQSVDFKNSAEGKVFFVQFTREKVNWVSWFIFDRGQWCCTLDH